MLLHKQVPICIACSEGDHDQILGKNSCSCPCHGAVGITPEAASVASMTTWADDEVAA